MLAEAAAEGLSIFEYTLRQRPPSPRIATGDRLSSKRGRSHLDLDAVLLGIVRPEHERTAVFEERGCEAQHDRGVHDPARRDEIEMRLPVCPLLNRSLDDLDVLERHRLDALP